MEITCIYNWVSISYEMEILVSAPILPQHHNAAYSRVPLSSSSFTLHVPPASQLHGCGVKNTFLHVLATC